MSDRDELLRRVKRVNPMPDGATLPFDLEGSQPPLALLIDDGQPTRGVGAMSTFRRFRGPAIAAAAMAVALAIGIPMLLLRGGGDGRAVSATTAAPTTAVLPTTTEAPPTTAEPTTTAAVTTTTTIPPMPAALAMTWEQMPAQEAFGLNDFIWSVVEGGPGLVAVGGVSDTPGEFDFTDGAVWVSEDGSTWERAGDPEVFSGVSTAFGTNMNQVLTQVAEGPGGLVATGWVDRDTGDTALPIWMSPDGLTWSRHPSDVGDYPDGPPEGALVSVETGYLLFGGVGGPVWASPDGSEWTRTVDAGTVDGPADAAMWVPDLGGVVPWDAGFIAVGASNVECSGNGFGACSGDLVGGFTTDGAAWETALIGSSRGWVYGLSAVGDRVLALGYDEDGVAAWMSMDGISWERSEIHGGAARDILLRDALQSGDRLLMAGGEFLGGMPLGAAVVFASDDGGVTWYEAFTASASDEGPFDGTNDQSVPGIRSLVEFDGTILAVGGTGNGSAPVWIGTWDEE